MEASNPVLSVKYAPRSEGGSFRPVGRPPGLAAIDHGYGRFQVTPKWPILQRGIVDQTAKGESCRLERMANLVSFGSEGG
jgi:hypothetical protein